MPRYTSRGPSVDGRREGTSEKNYDEISVEHVCIKRTVRQSLPASCHRLAANCVFVFCSVR